MAVATKKPRSAPDDAKKPAKLADKPATPAAKPTTKPAEFSKEQELKAYRDMLVEVRQRIQQLIAARKTMDEVVAAAPTKDFDAKWGSGYVTPDVFTKLVFSSLSSSSAAPDNVGAKNDLK